jgi:hypothetical protein
MCKVATVVELVAIFRVARTARGVVATVCGDVVMFRSCSNAPEQQQCVGRDCGLAWYLGKNGLCPNWFWYFSSEVTTLICRVATKEVEAAGIRAIGVAATRVAVARVTATRVAAPEVAAIRVAAVEVAAIRVAAEL